MRSRHGAGNSRKKAAALLAFLLLAAVLSSVALIALEAHHECTGEDCPICACVQRWEDLLRHAAAGAARVFAAAPAALLFLCAACSACAAALATPVSRKVRLND